MDMYRSRIGESAGNRPARRQFSKRSRTTATLGWNAVGLPDAFQKLANNDLCLANPDITPEEARLLKPGETLGKARLGTQRPVTLDFSKAQPLPPGYTIEKPPATDPAAQTVPIPQGATIGAPVGPSTLPADFFDKQKGSHSRRVEGTITSEAVIYSESMPGGQRRRRKLL